LTQNFTSVCLPNMIPWIWCESWPRKQLVEGLVINPRRQVAYKKPTFLTIRFKLLQLRSNLQQSPGLLRLERKHYWFTIGNYFQLWDTHKAKGPKYPNNQLYGAKCYNAESSENSLWVPYYFNEQFLTC